MCDIHADMIAGYNKTTRYSIGSKLRCKFFMNMFIVHCIDLDTCILPLRTNVHMYIVVINLGFVFDYDKVFLLISILAIAIFYDIFLHCIDWI